MFCVTGYRVRRSTTPTVPRRRAGSASSLLEALVLERVLASGH